MKLRLRAKTCKGCGERFSTTLRTQVVCSVECAQVFARQVNARKEERARRAALDALKSVKTVKGDVQRVFNAFILERDRDQPCISCGKFHEGAYDAGHFLNTIARPGLRFDEANVHKQCVPCNKHLSGNASAYRQGLIRRIGLPELKRLERDTAPHVYTRDDLLALKAHYAAKRIELKKARSQKND